MLDEINRRWPERDKTSDGSIGDEAHQQAGEGSDHNPWIKDGVVGVVRARDFDVDGIDATWLAEHLRLRGLHGDPRLRGGGYVIYNRRIAGWEDNWNWQDYSGDNPHTTHVHVSVSRNKIPGYDTTGPWKIVPQREFEPIQAMGLPRDFDPGMSAWSGGFNYLLENVLLEYATGSGAGRFVYRIALPEFNADIEYAGVAAVLTSTSPNAPSDVVLLVNGARQDTRQVPAASAGANTPYCEWTVPAKALVSGGINTVEFHVGPERAAGLRIFYKSGAGEGRPIRITVPAEAGAEPRLENDSDFVAQYVPVVMAPGSKHHVSVEMRNIGTKTWMPGRHKLGSDLPADNTRWGRHRAELERPVPPGGTTVFQFEVTAPATRGEHVFRWKMLEEGVRWFGPGTPRIVVAVGDAAPGPFQPANDRLRVGETLTRGAELMAENRLYKLTFQDDGNIVLYGLSPTRALWATNRRGAATLVLQSDGNLVAYDSQGRPAWDSETRGSRATFLCMQADGNLVLYTDVGKAVWATRTKGR
ncbi:hypothetical protein [Sorangium sp. So ce1151]|uniref:hypothetical protein n=1 Tax=Sorangium sp. So ce1151 TaxID=3133332 RepID=UPI003F5F43A1